MAIISDNNDFQKNSKTQGKNPIVKMETIEYDKTFENTIRPKTFEDYIGQTALKETLKISIEAAKLREKPLDHLLFYGPPGLGKTTLAGVIAEQMGADIKITSAPSLERPRDIIGILMSLKGGEILFIDEIHRLNKVAEEILYPAMEDFSLDMTTGKSQTVKTLRVPLPKFTLIGATTKAGELSGPLRDRFGIIHRLQFYTIEELTQVIKRTAGILDIKITEEGAVAIARRSRGTPRIANRLVKRVSDFALIKYDGVITDENRLNGALPTIKYLVAQGAKVILCSHLGKDASKSLAPVAVRLSEMLGQEVKFPRDEEVVGPNAKAAVAEMKDGDVILLENTRCRKEETKNINNYLINLYYIIIN